MIYDPDNPLSDKELDKLGEEDFDSFLEYLDGKTEHLKQFSKPLSSYHTKRFAALNAKQQGIEFTEKEIKKAGDIGKKNEDEAKSKIADRLAEYEKNHPKYRDEGIKNIKTHRSQWFD
jgi:hypothetical protein|tara:strand:+ start:1559 stop:1912 length:354 start_codon:yes stop_codon:yes gene_type:complete